MMNASIFYLHPTKCGGTSVAKVLQDLHVNHRQTCDLQLSKETLAFLANEEKVVIHGHVDHIRRPGNQEESQLYRAILQILYYKYNLIVPTRNPCNLLQSWMHYAKTRVNNILADPDLSSKPYIAGKDGGMVAKISCLRQDALLINLKDATIGKGPGFPIVHLKEEEEQENLIAFSAYLKNNPNQLPVLMPMQFQLFFPQWQAIRKCWISSKDYSIKLPQPRSSRFVHYYDCECMSMDTLSLLSSCIHPEFGGRLEGTRMNASQDKNKLKASDMPAVVSMMKEIAPNEWRIYEQALKGR